MAPRACGSQWGAPRPVKRGHEDDATAVGHGGGEGFNFGRSVENAKTIAQPLDGGTGDEDAAFERVISLAGDSPGDRGEQAMRRANRRCAGLQHQEAAGAVSIFRHAGTKAHLAEEGGLLIAGDAGNFSVGKKFGGDGEIATGVDNFRQHGAGNVEDVEQLLIPGESVDVKQQGARGVGDIGDVATAAGEFPDEPSVNGAEGELAGVGLSARSGNMLQDPANFAGGEVGVEDKAGFF